jgi:hypothetical protein
VSDLDYRAEFFTHEQDTELLGEALIRAGYFAFLPLPKQLEAAYACASELLELGYELGVAGNVVGLEVGQWAGSPRLKLYCVVKKRYYRRAISTVCLKPGVWRIRFSGRTRLVKLPCAD